MRNIVDAGPLISLLNDTDEFHEWAVAVLNRLGPPFYSCSEVIAEVAAMTEEPWAVVEMVRDKLVLLNFSLDEQADAVLSLMRKYRDQKMDLADACIVRMAELNRDCRVITVDSDFQVYRRNGREQIPLVSPGR